MKITATKIKRELVKNYGWPESSVYLHSSSSLISDTLDIINNILIKEKGVKIK